MGMYDSFYDEDSECPKCHTRVKDSWQTKRLESLLEKWRKGDFFQYRKVIGNPDWKPGPGLSGLAGVLKKLDEPVKNKPIIENGKVPVHTSCENCDARLEAYAQILKGRFVGIVEVEADGDPKDLFIIKSETTAEMLREDLNRKLSQLQESCNHKKTQWMDYQWAPAHFAGQVRVCLRCEKILERRNGWEPGRPQNRNLIVRKRKATRDMDLFRQACSPTGTTSEELSRELKKGRAQDKRGFRKQVPNDRA